MKINNSKFIAGALTAALVTIATFMPAFGEMIQNPGLSATQDGNPSIPMAGSDYFEYIPKPNKPRILIRDDTAPLLDVLMGDLNYAGGNVELFANSERLETSNPGYFPFYTRVTSVSGDFSSGDQVKLSSLLYDDWDPTNPLGLANQYIDDFLAAYPSFIADLNSPTCLPTILPPFLLPFTEADFQAAFNEVLWRFSDPNISYVNQDIFTGEICIGIAGLFNANSALEETLGLSPGFLKNSCGIRKIQFSEVAKLDLDLVNSPFIQSEYLYGFSAEKSGVKTRNPVSYTGTYEFCVQGTKPIDPIPPEGAPIDISKAKFTLYYTRIGDDRVSMNGFLEVPPGSNFALPFDEDVTIDIQFRNPIAPPAFIPLLNETVPAGSVDPAGTYRYLGTAPGIEELTFQVVSPTKIKFYLFADDIDLLPENMLTNYYKQNLSTSQYEALLNQIDSYYLGIKIGDDLWSTETPLYECAGDSRRIILCNNQL